MVESNSKPLVIDEEQLDSEVIFKPRCDYSNKALRKIQPAANNAKKHKLFLSQNIKKVNSQQFEMKVAKGKKSSRLFERFQQAEANYSMDLRGMNYVPKDVKFSSHKGTYLTKQVRDQADDVVVESKYGVTISEKDCENSSKSSDDDSASEGADSSDLAKSDDDSDGSSDSSVDQEEDEEKLYEQLLV